ncbi:hypothetical protein IWQ62_001060 [Dispira parvispora]|uniref:HAUS augmin-like complex subunit 6 N-terminal domain-containing protein n=1 Tax=Dispira parvispora TaxID=1520584 RepID=A0A9W8E9I0_9FUNG|nr:hypothetical protein IWQ62_001060 [Dispira parvispora]
MGLLSDSDEVSTETVKVPTHSNVVNQWHDVLNERQLLFTTLRLLGLREQQHCVGPYTSVPIHTEVFRQGHHHQKAAEVILKFLLDRLDPVQTRQLFIGCYPITDPRQAREFRNHAFKLLEQLRKECHPEHRPVASGRITQVGKSLNPNLRPLLAFPFSLPVRRSILDECRGPRFESLLFHLSRHVLACVLLWEHRCRWVSLSAPLPCDPPPTGNSVTRQAILPLSRGIPSEGLPLSQWPALFSRLELCLADALSTNDPKVTTDLYRLMGLVNNEAQTFLNSSAVYAHNHSALQKAAKNITEEYERHTAQLTNLQETAQRLQKLLTKQTASFSSGQLPSDKVVNTLTEGAIPDQSHRDLWETLQNHPLTQLPESFTTDHDLWTDGVDRALQLWKVLELFLEHSQSRQGAIDTVVQVYRRPVRLRARDHPLVIPDAMSDLWKQWLQTNSINPYQGTRLNLVEVLRMWRLGLQATVHATGLTAGEQVTPDGSELESQQALSARLPLSELNKLPHLDQPPHRKIRRLDITLSPDDDQAGTDSKPTPNSTELNHPQSDNNNDKAEGSDNVRHTFTRLLSQEKARLGRIRQLRAKLDQRKAKLIAQIKRNSELRVSSSQVSSEKPAQSTSSSRFLLSANPFTTSPPRTESKSGNDQLASNSSSTHEAVSLTQHWHTFFDASFASLKPSESSE